MPDNFLIYGAYGYTGALLAELAVRDGLRPILAGRDAEKLRLKALSLGLDHRAVSLTDDAALDEVLKDVAAVVHCAGPFSQTAEPMIAACIRTGTHYLDINGAIEEFETLAGWDAEARNTGVMVLPGVGFDVVPTDCLALHLKQQLPDATHLTIAFLGFGSRVSQGTALSALGKIGTASSKIRQDGVIISVPLGGQIRKFDFGRGLRAAVGIPWGDVFTAYWSTGIPNIEVYSGNFTRLRWMLRLLPVFKPILSTRWAQDMIEKVIRAQPPGPSEQQRLHGGNVIYAEVRDDAGNMRAARLKTPESYELTALTALASVQKVLAGQAPAGFQTPAKAYGPEFILEIEGTQRVDLP